jgi:hypothetical protein
MRTSLMTDLSAVPTPTLVDELKRREADAEAVARRHLIAKQQLMREILAGRHGDDLYDAFIADVAQCYSEGSRRFSELCGGAVALYRLDFHVNDARGCYEETT